MTSDKGYSPSFGAALQQYSYDKTSALSPNRRSTRTVPSIKPLLELSPAKPSPLRQKATASEASTSGSPATASMKRKASATGSPSPSKKKRPSSGYAPPGKYANITNLLTDSLAPNLICVFIGVNPGIRTATAGHAYAHPSNLFWKLCHSSGCTPRLCKPEEDGDLPRLYALGHTNIVTRPTKDASELSAKEMDEGVEVLEEKISRYRPESVCIVGKGIWESIWRVRRGKKIKKDEFKYGWQDETENMGVARGTGHDILWKGASVFVATTTSGLAAGMRPPEKEAIWSMLGAWVAQRRREMGIPDVGRVKEDVLEDVGVKAEGINGLS